MRIHAISLYPLSDTQKSRLGKLGELHYHDAVLGDLNAGELCRRADVVLVTPRLAVDIVPYLDGCRLISVQGTGTDAINLAAAREKGIAVTNVPDFCTDAVAEHAFALILAAAKRIEDGRMLLTAGAWNNALAYTTIGLRGKTLGLFGCGRIGSRIAQIAEAFGMRVRATVRDPSKSRGVDTVPVEKLLADSDVIVLAAPASTETTGIFDAGAFARMKPGSILVNVSRAALVNDAAFLEALDKGPLAAAGIDVFQPEPPAPDNPLLHHPKLVVSPHVAWGTSDALQRLLDLSIQNVEDFLAGKPANVVN
jgi:glycerate dehydrogenase